MEGDDYADAAAAADDDDNLVLLQRAWPHELFEDEPEKE